MAVQDDVRRLSQLDSIYLGYNTQGMTNWVTGWHKGRLQQANDGTWIFRSSASDGSVVGFQLGSISDWTSNESPSSGIVVQFQIYQNVLAQSPTAGQQPDSVHYFRDCIFTATITGGIDQLNFKLCEHAWEARLDVAVDHIIPHQQGRRCLPAAGSLAGACRNCSRKRGAPRLCGKSAPGRY